MSDISPIAAGMKFSTPLPEEKQHLIVTDCATDISSRKLAIGFSDGSLSVFSGDKFATCEGTVAAHERAVIRIAWIGGYRSGFVIASTGMDGRVCIFRDNGNFPPPGTTAGKNSTDDIAAPLRPASWQKLFEHAMPAICPAVAWSPPQYGLIVAAACGDGSVAVFSSDGTSGNWATKIFKAHPRGCTAVTWAPFLSPSAINALPLVPAPNQQPGALGVAIPNPRLATGGRGERAVKIWKYFSEDKDWGMDQNLNELPAATTCVRDVSWAPNSSGLPFSYLAACTDEGVVTVWRQDGTEGIWQHSVIATGRAPSIPVCRLHWSAAGSVLTTVWKDGKAAQWLEVPKTGEWQLAATQSNER